MATAATESRLLKLAEASERCAYSVSSLRRAIERGDLAAVRLGPTERHALRIREDDLERWLRPARGGEDR